MTDFKYMKLTSEGQEHVDAIRKAFEALDAVLALHLKPSRETSLVSTKLEEASAWAIKGCSRQAGNFEE